MPVNQAPALFAPLDLCILTAIVVLAPVAWLVPHRLWPKLGRGTVNLALPLASRTLASRTARISRLLGPAAVRLPAREIILQGLTHHFEDTLLLLKCYRPGGWTPVTRLQGLEYLEAATAGGKAAVLWLSHFMYSSIATKMALRQAGVHVIHLSHPRHGFSPTRFGMRFLNPVRLGVENRYLRERVSTGLDGATAAVNTLRERLQAGNIVSLTARDSGRTTLGVPFLGGSLRLATGAPGLALLTGTALLPVHTVRTDAGEFLTIIDPPIRVDDTQSRRDASAAAAREYACSLESVVREFPDQWLGWSYLEDAPADQDHHE